MYRTVPPPPRSAVERTVRVALEEDLGRGDVTTASCVPSDHHGRAVLRARAPIVLCGLDVVREVYRQVDADVRVEARALDGDRLEAGAEAARLAGTAASLLSGERVALNFVQRLSGVATIARQYVDAVPVGATVRITDTRKTTPGLRALERYAVRCGGAHNHRDDLAAAVLIKDNHIAAAGGVRAAVDGARRLAPHTSRIECEVDTLGQLDEALDAGVDVVLLDNFDDAMVAEGVRRARGRAIVEVSGGITLERVPTLANAGVEIISVGALTHSAPAADVGLDWVGEP
ncbi:MAG: carboxylating nicotinate-nucleotide diphosphorylase [Myxococcota bacterium]